MILRIALVVFVGTVALIGAFAFFTPHANQGNEQAPVVHETPQTIPPITFKDSYKKGVHTVSGEVHAPTPCTALSASAETASGTPETITVNLVMPEDTGICLQEVTPLAFKVTASAGIDARTELYVNGAFATSSIQRP